RDVCQRRPKLPCAIGNFLGSPCSTAVYRFSADQSAGMPDICNQPSWRTAKPKSGPGHSPHSRYRGGSGAITGFSRSPKAGSPTKGCGIKKLAFALSMACLFTPASARAQNAYITNADDTVSVIATASNTVVGSPITVGKNPFAFGLFIQACGR